MRFTSLATAALLGVAPSLIAAQAEGTAISGSSTLGSLTGTATDGTSSATGVAGGQGGLPGQPGQPGQGGQGGQPGQPGQPGGGIEGGEAPGGGLRVHPVAVGKNPQTNETALKFFPERIQAQAGEMVQMQYMGGNHSVMLSEFDRPCAAISITKPGAADIWSGYQPANPSSGTMPTFTFMVNDTKPLWLCCTQGTHCQKGMCMVINENTQGNASRSLENFKQLAASVPENAVLTPATAGAANGGAGGGSTGGTAGQANVPSGAGPSVAVPATMLLLLLGAAFALL